MKGQNEAMILQLESLHAQGWSDAEIASMVRAEIMEAIPECRNHILVSPSGQTINRWRTGKSKPSSVVTTILIGRIYEEKGVEDGSDNEDKD